MRRTIIAAVALGAAGLFPAPVRAAATVPVFMSNWRFCSTPVCVDNQDVTIASGDTVVFAYADPGCLALHALACYHTATTISKPFGADHFDSGAMPGTEGTFGGTNPKLVFEVTLTVPGTYTYVCVVHGGRPAPFGPMKAKIVVT